MDEGKGMNLNVRQLNVLEAQRTTDVVVWLCVGNGVWGN